MRKLSVILLCIFGAANADYSSTLFGEEMGCDCRERKNESNCKTGPAGPTGYQGPAGFNGKSATGPTGPAGSAGAPKMLPYLFAQGNQFSFSGAQTISYNTGTVVSTGNAITLTALTGTNFTDFIMIPGSYYVHFVAYGPAVDAQLECEIDFNGSAILDPKNFNYTFTNLQITFVVSATGTLQTKYNTYGDLTNAWISIIKLD